MICENIDSRILPKTFSSAAPAFRANWAYSKKRMFLHMVIGVVSNSGCKDSPPVGEE